MYDDYLLSNYRAAIAKKALASTSRNNNKKKK